MIEKLGSGSTVQIPAEALATFPYRSHIVKKRGRKVIITEVK